MTPVRGGIKEGMAPPTLESGARFCVDSIRALAKILPGSEKRIMTTTKTTAIPHSLEGMGFLAINR